MLSYCQVLFVQRCPEFPFETLQALNTLVQKYRVFCCNILFFRLFFYPLKNLYSTKEKNVYIFLKWLKPRRPNSKLALVLNHNQRHQLIINNYKLFKNTKVLSVLTIIHNTIAILFWCFILSILILYLHDNQKF